MPYRGPDDPMLPAYVRRLPRLVRRRWVAVWNRAYADCRGKRREADDCEGYAFRVANGVAMAGLMAHPAEGEPIVALASAATIRRRVFARFAYGLDDIERLAREIATVRVAAAEQRLAELRAAMGLPGRGRVAITDDVVLRAITRESRDAAAGIVMTHNRQLREFLARQPRDLSQRKLAARVQAWERARAEWKAKQIAFTEGMTARNDIDREVLTRNGLRVRARVAPQRAAEPICAGLVARGWMEPHDLPRLPAHPNCIHGLEYDTRLRAAVRARARIWLGDWLPGPRGGL
jgi:hypothetical protein